MGITKFLLGLIFSLSCMTYSQSFIKDNVHPFSRSLLGTATGGITIGKTDYREVKPGINGSLSASYFFPTTNENILGLRLLTEISNVSGKDVLKTVATPTGSRSVPEIFSTDVISFNASLLYSYAISQDFLPYVALGLTYYFFNPKDENGKLLYNNQNNNYDKKTLGFNPEFGIDIPINSQINIEVNSVFHFLFTDYLDDVAFGKNKDFFATISLGISYAFINNRDSDGDGLTDDEETNIYRTNPRLADTDFDGLSDFDEVKKYKTDPLKADTDGDGLNDSEEVLKYNTDPLKVDTDNDGLSDGDEVLKYKTNPLKDDTDSDGLNDADEVLKYKTDPLKADTDNDGLSDYDEIFNYKTDPNNPDTDGDGIPDKTDKCPNQPETFNGYQDNDGCPDEVPNTNTENQTEKDANTFVLAGDEIFYPNRAEIKPEAYNKLNEIVTQLKNKPDAFWRIEGHMDSQGPEQWIRTMSSKRAEAVYYYFISHGLDASKFTIYGLGDKFPVANSNTEEGRAKNRRVVIVKEQP
jgi:outer membrane protein OmpA-like peptidoglycan-associated protein